jgi:hypothetical protein
MVPSTAKTLFLEWWNMSQSKLNQTSFVEAADPQWASLYRIAGAGALAAVVFMLLDIALSFTGGDLPVGELSAVDWFAHFQSSWFVGLRNLGLFNVINPLLMLPLYLAVYKLHRGRCPAGASLALILCVVGIAVYSANNRALAMLELSSQYAQAATETQRSLLASTGAVILAQAEDFTPATFLGFFLQNAASLLMAAVMLRGKVFSRRIALMGLVGMSCLLIFTVCATFFPATFSLAMVPALFGGLLMLAWTILMALALFRLGRGTSNQPGLSTRPVCFNPSEPGL